MEAAVGQPLAKDPKRDDVFFEIWFYSLGESPRENYWRRWVIFEDGRVSIVLSDYKD